MSGSILSLQDRSIVQLINLRNKILRKLKKRPPQNARDAIARELDKIELEISRREPKYEED